MKRFAVVLGLALLATPAAAACRDDLIAVDQAVHRSRADVQKASAAAPAAKCAAYRKHVAALTKIREVFGRCDTSADKAKNAAQATTAIAEFAKQVQANCKR